MFELQELLPYLFSIGLIFTVSYAYIAHLHCGLTEYWMEGGGGDGVEPGLPTLTLDGQHRPEDLTRMIRRRKHRMKMSQIVHPRWTHGNPINEEDIYGT